MNWWFLLPIVIWSAAAFMWFGVAYENGELWPVPLAILCLSAVVSLIWLGLTI